LFFPTSHSAQTLGGIALICPTDSLENVSRSSYPSHTVGGRGALAVQCCSLVPPSPSDDIRESSLVLSVTAPVYTMDRPVVMILRLWSSSRVVFCATCCQCTRSVGEGERTGGLAILLQQTREKREQKKAAILLDGDYSRSLISNLGCPLIFAVNMRAERGPEYLLIWSNLLALLCPISRRTLLTLIFYDFLPRRPKFLVLFFR